MPITWERAPFERCPFCGTEGSFGFLSAGGRQMVQRCIKCQESLQTQLPEVDKEVIYLDQFVFSELFKVRSGRYKGPHEEFWREVDHLIRTALLWQQAVFPHSNVHHDETIMSPWPRELKKAYEGVGGDIALIDTNDIQLMEIAEFASAFISGKDPALSFEIDVAIRGKRNEWLPDMRVSVNTDYSQFAERHRENAQNAETSIANLMAGWQKQGLGFDDVLEFELGAYFLSRVEALTGALQFHEKAIAEGDIMAELNLSLSPVFRELSLLQKIFTQAGVPGAEIDSRSREFWNWERNREQMYGRILAYMFAGLAGQVKAGRKKPPTRGFLKDVTAISAYAPYVNAMFIDNECATILSQGRARDELKYRARLFSLNNGDEFLEYLKEVSDRASGEVRSYANLLYGA